MEPNAKPQQQILYEKQVALQLLVATTLAESSTVHNAGYNILKTICEILSFKMGEIWAVDAESQVIRYVLNWHKNSLPKSFLTASDTLILKQGEELPGFIWRNKKIYVTDNLQKTAFLQRKKKFANLGFNCCVGFPVLYKDEVNGVVLLYGNKSEDLDPQFLAVFENIGKQIGSFFKNKRLEKDLLFLKKHDLLTGLSNKEMLEEFLEIAIIKAKKTQSILALFYLNLDHLKNVNYSLGHAVGDLVLQEIAKRLQNSSRKTDLVARLGGDEFAIVLTGIKLKEQIDLVAKKILKQFDQPFMMDKGECYITTSIGISIYPQDGATVKNLFIAAGLAMSHTKHSGRNNYQYVYSSWQKLQQKSIIMETKLHQAVKKNEFFICYQPIVNIKTNRISSAEALIRWKNAEGEIILPMDFIPLLEQSSLIHSIGGWILETACKQFHVLREYGLPSVSINISVNQLNQGLVNSLQNMLALLALKPRNIILEITESALAEKNRNIDTILNTLNKMGVKLAIDDFGTGYSSFTYLKNFKVAYLKIDKSFIVEINKNKSTNAIVKAIIVMAHALKMEVTAEGVEKKEQLEFLKVIGCDAFQGYYYSKPLSVAKLVNKLKKEAAGVASPVRSLTVIHSTTHRERGGEINTD